MSPRSLAIPEAASDLASGPSFLVGQDGAGRWIALEVHGLAGGLFRSREGAVHYARDESRGRAGAVRLVAEPLALAIA